jgi:L-ascorbate metabolism protein UlaG (beta-lactamase superfamily)
LENINLCHLGPFEEKNFTPEIKEEIGEVDILFVPVLEGDGEKASQVIAQIEPKIAIPTSYRGIKPEEKLTIKKKDLSEGKTQIIVLSPVI